MIVRITRWNDDYGENFIVEGPVWAKVNDNLEIKGELIKGEVFTTLLYLKQEDGDVFEIIPEDEVPDEIWALIAQRELMS